MVPPNDGEDKNARKQRFSGQPTAESLLIKFRSPLEARAIVKLDEAGALLAEALGLLEAARADTLSGVHQTVLECAHHDLEEPARAVRDVAANLALGRYGR